MKFRTISYLAIIIALAAYAIKTNSDLKRCRKIRAKEVLCLVMDPPVETYMKLEGPGSLPEPPEIKTANILDRVQMLRSHLPYGPSSTWVSEILDECENEIRSLRGDLNKAP